MGGWTPEQDLEFSFIQALKAARVDLIRMQKDHDDEKLRTFAQSLIRQLKFHNWKIERGNPRGGASSHQNVGTGTPSTFKEFDESNG